MSVHIVLENQIKSIETVVSWEETGQRIEMLPALTKVIERTASQALLLCLKTGLVEQVFELQPACSLDDLRSYLRQPLAILNEPEQVFVIDQDELEQFRSRLEACREQSQALIDQIKQQLDDFEDGIHQEMDMVRAILQIPDLLPDAGGARQVRQVLAGMSRVLEQAQAESTLTDAGVLKRLADEWKQLYTTFTRIREKLSFDSLQADYGFSDDTVAVIERLVSGQMITMDALTSQTIAELQQFRQFCRQIVLRFTAQD